MGDRTYLSVTCKPEDRQKFVVIFGQYYHDGGAGIDGPAPPCAEVRFAEVGGGGVNELERLALAGLTFLATLDAGDGYDPAAVVGHGGEFVKVPSDFYGVPVVRWEGLDEPSTIDVDSAQAYWRLRAKADEALGIADLG